MILMVISASAGISGATAKMLARPCMKIEYSGMIVPEVRNSLYMKCVHYNNNNNDNSESYK